MRWTNILNGPGVWGRLSVAGFAATSAFALFVTFSVAVISQPVGNLVRDLMLTTLSPFDQPPESIVVVSIDEATLKRFPYRSPIDRAFLASLIDRIAAGRPAAIGIDLLFDQPTEPAKDDALRQTLARAQVPVILASAWASDGLTPAQLAWLAEFSTGSGRGLAALSRDPLDGVVRGAFPGREKDGIWQPSLAAAMAQAVGISASRRFEELVYYRTAEATPWKLPVYPAATAMIVPPAWFTGKFVLIGVDLPLEDRHPTPFIAINGVKAGTLPGVVIHAHALARLVQGDRLVTPGLPTALGLTLLFGSAGAWVAWRSMSVILKPLAVLIVVLVLWACGALLFSRTGILLPLVVPTVLVLAISTFVGFLAWRRDQESKRFLKRAFSQYVSPAVVDAIVGDPDQLRLGGERRRLTCVFTDLEGFTSISESMSPERLAEVLNTYLDRMCDTFVEHGATIDKVIGDAVVGFFGAPAHQGDQALRGVRLALAVDRLSEAFRTEMAEKGLQLGVTRIGVHSGHAIVGNFGGKRFFDYTVIGDTMNTAARLEGANKYIGTRICVSGETMREVAGVLSRPSGVLFLKGKHEGVATFEPLPDLVENRIMVDEFRAAWALLEAGSPLAIQDFRQLAVRYPSDRLVALHLDRLERGETGPAIRLSEK